MIDIPCPVCGRPTTGETIGKRLKLALSSKGMTQRELARALESPGTSYANLRRYVTDEGEPSIKTLREMSEVLGVTALWLTFGLDGLP